MHAAATIAFKDLKILFRDRAALFWVTAMPLIMATLFGAIFGSETSIHEVKVAVVDQDRTDLSRSFVKRLEKSKGLVLTRKTLKAAKDAVRQGKMTGYVLIRRGFGNVVGMSPGNGQFVEIGMDPSKKAERGFLKGMVTEAIFKGFQEQFAHPEKLRRTIHQSVEALRKAQMNQQAGDDRKHPGLDQSALIAFLDATETWLTSADTADLAQGMNMKDPTVVTVSRARGEEPASSYEVTFPASTIWGILGIVAAFAGLIVRERSQGTLLRFRVSPVSWAQVAAGKGLSAFLAYLAMSAGMLLLGAVIFSIRIVHPFRLAMALVSSGVCVTGLVLLVAPMGKTERAVSGASWGVMMPFAIFGGATIPLSMMPSWMRMASNFSPLKWSVLAMEGAIWRNFSLFEMLVPCAVLLVFGLACAVTGSFVLSRQDAA